MLKKLSVLLLSSLSAYAIDKDIEDSPCAGYIRSGVRAGWITGGEFAKSERTSHESSQSEKPTSIISAAYGVGYGLGIGAFMKFECYLSMGSGKPTLGLEAVTSRVPAG